MIQQSKTAERGDDPWRNEMKDTFQEGDTVHRHRRVYPWLLCSVVLLAFAVGYISAASQQPAVALAGPLVVPETQSYLNHSPTRDGNDPPPRW